MTYSSNFITAVKIYLGILILGRMLIIFFVVHPLSLSIEPSDFSRMLQAYSTFAFLVTVGISVWGILSDSNGLHRLGWGMINFPYLLPIFFQLLFRPHGVQEVLFYITFLGVLGQLLFFLAVYLIGEPENLVSYLLVVVALIVTGILGSLALRDFIPEIIIGSFSILSLLGSIAFLGYLIAKADKLSYNEMQLQATYPTVEIN